MDNRLIIELLGLEKGKAYGFQEYIFNLLTYFYIHREDIRFQQIIICCKNTERSMFERYEDKFKIDTYNFRGYLKRHLLQTYIPIKYKLTKRDLLFSSGNYSGLIKRGNEVLTIHDLLFKRKSLSRNIFFNLQREILLPISIKKADSIVAISNFTKQDIEKYYPISRGKISVIYNSMNFDKFCTDKKTEITPIDYFLAISSNKKNKNQKTIVSAFRNYCENNGEKNLIFVGKINEKSESGMLMRDLPQEVKDRIIVKSDITNSELGVLYRGASCFVSASLFEGLGMPVVEAMSFGLPVLLSDIPPHREVSMNKGEYFNPLDSNELCLKMLRMTFEKRDYSLDIKEMFSEENTSAKYVELFNKFAYK